MASQEQGVIHRLSKQAEHLAREWQMWAADQTPVPSLLADLYPTERPNAELSIELTDRQLYAEFLFRDAEGNKAHPMGLAGEFNKHFAQYQVANTGLETGSLSWPRAREFLHDAFGSNNPRGVTDVYIFWMDTLREFIGRAETDGNRGVEILEAKSDRTRLERTIVDAISREKRPMLRAYFTAAFISAKPSLSVGEQHDLMQKASDDMMKVLPKPADFAREYQRRENQRVYPEHKTAVRYEKHGNDLYWMMTFANMGRIHGFGGEGKEYGAGPVGPVERYLLDVLRAYDPAAGDPHMTARLTRFSTKAFVPRPLRTYFRRRVATALPAFGPGIHEKPVPPKKERFDGRDTLLEGLVYTETDLGHLKKAYAHLKKIREETTMEHAATAMLEEEVLHGDPANIEAVYRDVLIPMVANKWKQDVAKTLRGRTEFSKHQRKWWLLHKVFAGMHLAEEHGNFSVLNSAEIRRYIRRGEMDGLLDTLADSCTDDPKSRRLNRLVLERIERVFAKENERLAKSPEKDDGVNHTDDAIKALMMLRKKNLLEGLLQERSRTQADWLHLAGYGL